jgi:hypothetical protein
VETSGGAPHAQDCKRCGLNAPHAAWCPRCGLSLRHKESAQASLPPIQPGVTPPLPGLLWDRVPGQPHPALKAGGGALLAFVVLVVAAAAANGGGSSIPAQFTSPAASESFPTETEPVEEQPVVTSPTTESTPTEAASTVEPYAVEGVLDEYSSYYSAENVEGLKGLFSPNLVRRDRNKAPETLSQALKTYKKQFGELDGPEYALSEVNVEPGEGEASATAHYSITSQNGTVGGSIEFHLVEEQNRLVIEGLTISK